MLDSHDTEAQRILSLDLDKQTVESVLKLNSRERVLLAIRVIRENPDKSAIFEKAPYAFFAAGRHLEQTEECRNPKKYTSRITELVDTVRSELSHAHLDNAEILTGRASTALETNLIYKILKAMKAFDATMRPSNFANRAFHSLFARTKNIPEWFIH